MDPGKILSPVDCETERTPAELVEWFEEKNDLFRSTKEGKNYLVLRKGLAKRFIDEIYPLSRLVRHLFGERVDVVCKPNFSDDDCDAIVIDYCDRPLRIQRIEFTRAIFCYENYLRRLYFPGEGQLFTLSKLMSRDAKGARTEGRAEEETVPHVVLLNKGLELVVEAARQKSTRPYGTDTSLVIVFDDYATFKSQEDLATLEEFVNTEVLPIDMDFDRLFLLGWSGSTILGFSLVGGGVPRAQQR